MVVRLGNVMKKIYLAAKWKRMPEMAEIGDKLKALGHEITAQWIYNKEEGKTKTENAVMDMCDVEDADTLICFTHPREEGPQPGGGRHVEFGMAAAQCKDLFIVGPREIIFHWLPGVTVFKDTEEMLAYFTPVSGFSNV